MHRRVIFSLGVLVILSAACGGDDPGFSDDAEFDSDGSAADELSEAVCDPDLVGDDEGPVTSIYAIENGRLAGLCWGDPDEAVTGAFELLEAVTQADQLADLAYVGGFDGGGDTLAFVTPVDDDYDGFVMAIDTVSAVDDPAELRLTVVHEFAHVFTQTNEQLDLFVGPDSCSTFWNGVGCFIPGSYLDSWVQAFWSDEEIRSLPADGSADEEGGEARCEVDPGFLGAYAASSPEEDFAEAYSAYVFDLEVPAEVQPRLAFFDDFPELAEARSLAQESGVGAVPNSFDRCG